MQEVEDEERGGRSLKGDVFRELNNVCVCVSWLDNHTIFILFVIIIG